MSVPVSARPTFRRNLALRSVLAAAATAAALLSAGCANMVTTASPANSFSGAATITGSIHGGNQPVTGASVKLYAAGTTGYGAPGVLFATTTSGNDAFGSFTFIKSATNTGNTTPGLATYGCPVPTQGDPQMYIVATGGATQGTGNGNNSAAAFIAAIGKCSTISAATFVDLNEVTSVATLAALQQYFSPVTDSLGYPATTQGTLGFANGVSTIANLASIATGTANAGSTLTATPAGAATAVTVNVLPEFAKINTIANITAACVNNASSTAGACTTLFANALPQTNTYTSQPTIVYPTLTSDVLQATYYMLTNPTSGGAAQINTLYGLAPAAAPFQPTLSGPPTDWTIGVRYSSASTCNTTSGTFLTAPYSSAIDAMGNVWIASGGTSTTSSNLIELSPTGLPLTCALGTAVLAAKGLTIDTGGNVWIASNAANAPFYKYNIASGTSTTWPVPTGGIPYAVEADGFGNIFYTDISNKVVNEFVAAATTAVPTAAVNVATVGNAPFFITADTAGRLIVSQSATTNFDYEVYPSTAAGNTNGYATATIGTATNVLNPYGFAAGLNGSIWAANSSSTGVNVSQTAYYITPSTTAPGTVAFSTNSAQYAGGIGAPRGPLAVDGAGNVWIANASPALGNYVAGTTTGSAYTISEIAANGIALSPSPTSAGNGSTSSGNGGFQKDATILTTQARGTSVDISGNVWVTSNSGTGNGVVEYVGAGVPVATPVAAGLAAGITSTNAVQKP